MAATAGGGLRPYQVVVWGATGFTGRLVCEALVRDYKGVRWAMAGRSRQKLEEVRRELAKIDPQAAEAVPLVLADAGDAASLRDLAAQTQVIISTAGPFAKWGDAVVAAAVQQRTHYADITGELLWVKRQIAAHDEAARGAGVKVVHCAGYDSVPFDLGVLLLADHARKQLKRGLSQAYGLSLDARGGFSGGTLASGFNQAEAEDPAEVARLMGDKYYLLPEGARRGSDTPPGLLPEWNALAGLWMAPFVMEPINSRVVQRSSFLAGGYGRDFKYREAMATRGLAAALGMSAFMATVGAVFALGPLRSLAKRRLPQPGEGPSREVMDGGFWRHRMIGLTDEPEGGQPQVVVAEVADEHGDPGYRSTSRMLLEAGLCLALDAAACKEAGCLEGGVLTPASALGMVLVDRLRRAGFRFEVTQSPALGGAKQQQEQSAAA